MQEEARIAFYDIKEFGFYKRSEETPAFGSLSSTLAELQNWASDKTIGMTKTFEVDGSVLPAYLVDLRRRGQAWLLTLWNETANTDGAVASMSAYANVGNSEITMNPLAEGDIPGFASYFWFLPDHDVVATVRFQHPGSGRLQMISYLQKFMATFSASAVTELDSEGELRVVGYRESPASPLVRARPRFKIAIHRRPAEQQFLVNAAADIRKLKKQAVLTLNVQPDRAMWQRLLIASHLTEPTVRPHDVKINYELEVDGMSEADVLSVIEGWDEEQNATDYGFVLKGESNVTHWLGKAVAKETLMLDINRLNPEIVEAQSLIEILAHNRNHLLNLLQ